MYLKLGWKEFGSKKERHPSFYQDHSFCHTHMFCYSSTLFLRVGTMFAAQIVQYLAEFIAQNLSSRRKVGNDKVKRIRNRNL